MKEQKLILYNDKIFYIDRYIYESEEMFYFRINYIYYLLQEQKKISFEDMIGLSKIELEKKFKHCDYLST